MKNLTRASRSNTGTIEESTLNKFRVRRDQPDLQIQSTLVCHRLDRLVEHMKSTSADKLELLNDSNKKKRIQDMTNEEIVRLIRIGSMPAVPPMSASEVLRAIDLESEYIAEDNAKSWINVMMNARTGVAQAYQVNRSLFPMIRWLSVPRGEDANYFIQCDRKLNVLSPTVRRSKIGSICGLHVLLLRSLHCQNKITKRLLQTSRRR